MVKKSFTLIELLVVIAIIGILAAVILVALNSARQKAKDVKVQADLAQIRPLMENWINDNGTYNIGTCSNYIEPDASKAHCSTEWANGDATKTQIITLSVDIKNTINQTATENPAVSRGLKLKSSDSGAIFLAVKPSTTSGASASETANGFFCYDTHGNFKIYDAWNANAWTSLTCS